MLPKHSQQTHTRAHARTNFHKPTRTRTAFAFIILTLGFAIKLTPTLIDTIVLFLIRTRISHSPIGTRSYSTAWTRILFNVVPCFTAGPFQIRVSTSAFPVTESVPIALPQVRANGTDAITLRTPARRQLFQSNYLAVQPGVQKFLYRYGFIEMCGFLVQISKKYGFCTEFHFTDILYVRLWKFNFHEPLIQQ